MKDLSGPNDFRPGLVAFAHELAGDFVAWDLRRGRPTEGSPAVLYCDHETAIAVPFARDVAGALVHVVMRSLIGESGRRSATEIARALDTFGEVLPVRDRKRLAALATKFRVTDRAVVLPNETAARRAVAWLLPKNARGGLCRLPSTYFPLLKPDDAGCLTTAKAAYLESIATYREMITEEGRSGFAWHLAAALRGLADVSLRSGKLRAAGAAASEAVPLYESIYAAGDARVETHLAFVHRVLSVTETRAKRHANAVRHAERALALSESSLAGAYEMVRALGSIAEAFLLDRSGGKRDEVNLRIRNGHKWSTPFLEREPPHPLRPHAEVIARIAALPSRGRQA